MTQNIASFLFYFKCIPLRGVFRLIENYLLGGERYE